MKLKRLALVGGLLFGFGSVVHAVPFDTFLPDAPYTLSDNRASQSYSHLIPAYVPGDTLTGGTLTLFFEACTGPPCTSGQFTLTVGGVVIATRANFAAELNFELDFAAPGFEMSPSSDDGIEVTLTLTRTNAAGDAILTRSEFDVLGQLTNTGLGERMNTVLSAHTNNGFDVTSVPEPISLALLGFGLAGLGLLRRRRAA